MDNLIIDMFAGGGGASVGIEMALGRQVDIAVDHDPMAIKMHQMNHPNSLHLTEDVFSVNLAKYVKGRHVALMWASPDCTSHSKAKGGQPRESGLRILPWAVVKQTKSVMPDVVIMENVEEIQEWGPLDENGYPIKEKAGQDYLRFVTAMMSLGYEFDSRELIAADYGAPTTRKRWYAIFRRDGRKIIWPEPTNSKNGDGLDPWVPVSTVLDFSDLGTSIFDRKKPLAEKTMKRIARGIQKFVIDDPEPFIVQVNHGGDSFRGQSIHDPMPTITSHHGFGTVTPYIIQYHSETTRDPRGQSVNLPLKTIDTSNRYGLVSAFITKFYKSGTGQDVRDPLHTITTSPGHFGLVSAFMLKYYGQGEGQTLKEPLHTITTKDRFALITVMGQQYAIADIYLRMLTPEELKLAQGFPKDYIIDRYSSWKPVSHKEQVARIGNSVVPIMAQQLVKANCGYLKVGERKPNIAIYSERKSK